MITQLELFENRVPAHAYCADQLGFTFLRVKSNALRRQYIQPNSPNETQCLVFDVDRESAAIDWDDLHCPAPSIITRNPENGHAHLVYLLGVPVHHNPDGSSRAHPIRYLASIEASLRDKLQADPAYSGLLTKNPTHPRWEILLRQNHPYDLAWLADYLDLSKYADKRKNLPPVGLARNCTTFDRTRKWAYSEIRKPQSWFGYEFWFSAVLSKALSINSGFMEPLTSREVRGIAKSIAKWVWENMSFQGFQDWCSRRGKKSGKVRMAKAEAKAELALFAKKENPDLSNRALAKKLGIAESSLRLLLKGAQGTISDDTL